MRDVKPTHGKQPGTDQGIPTNPVQSPKIGDENMVEPPQQAEDATWQTYRSSTAHAEPPGQLDRRGIREQSSGRLKRPARAPSRRRRESTDKDE